MVLVVTASLMRVVWVELGVQVGLENVGVVGDTDKAEKVEAEIATRTRGRSRGEGVDYDRCSFLLEAIPL